MYYSDKITKLIENYCIDSNGYIYNITVNNKVSKIDTNKKFTDILCFNYKTFVIDEHDIVYMIEPNRKFTKIWNARNARNIKYIHHCIHCTVVYYDDNLIFTSSSRLNNRQFKNVSCVKFYDTHFEVTTDISYTIKYTSADDLNFIIINFFIFLFCVAGLFIGMYYIIALAWFVDVTWYEEFIKLYIFVICVKSSICQGKLLRELVIKYKLECNVKNIENKKVAYDSRHEYDQNNDTYLSSKIKFVPIKSSKT